MYGVTATEVSGMALEINSILNVECYVLTRTEASGSAGGIRVTYTAAPSAILCRLSPLSAKETVYSDKLQGEMGWTVIVPENTTVSGDDKLSIGSRTFEIIGVKSYPSYPILKRLICQEVT